MDPRTEILNALARAGYGPDSANLLVGQVELTRDASTLREAAAAFDQHIDSLHDDAASTGRANTLGPGLLYGSTVLNTMAANVERGEKDTGQRAGESTHPRPCEYPDVRPCLCGGNALLDIPVDEAGALRRSRAVAAFFAGARWARVPATVGGGL